MDAVRKLFRKRRLGNGDAAEAREPYTKHLYQRIFKSVSTWFLPRNGRGTVNEAKLEAIAAKLFESYKYKSPDGSIGPKSFIVHRDLEETFTREVVDELFKNCPWFKKELVDTCRYDFACVIATLIQSNWKDWDNFGSIFLEHTDERSDKSIPMPATVLEQFLSGPMVHTFEHWQYLHKPYIFEEKHYTEPGSEPLHLQEKIRLPIIATSPIFHNVTHDVPSEVKGVKYVRIDHSSLRSKSHLRGSSLRSSKSNLNTKPQDLVLKIISDQAAFRREWDFYNRHRSSSDAICYPLAIFWQGDSGFLLMPRADCDLFQFLTADVVNFEVMAEHSTPYAVLLQVQHIAEAISSIHQQGQRHCDLKPENILIFLTPKHDVIRGVGRWKMTDMGLSQEAPRSKNPNIREFSSFPARRGTGAFQAPETHENTKSVNEKTDMWSLGCIICVCLAFIIDGWREVDRLTIIRQQSSVSESVGITQDWFWTWTNQNNKTVVKSHVLAWLDELPVKWKEASGSTDSGWLQKLALLVKELLNVERDKRPDAKETIECLKDVIELTKGLERPWKLEPRLAPPSPPGIHPTIEATGSKAGPSRLGKRVSFSDTAQHLPNLLAPGLRLRRPCLSGDRNIIESRMSADGTVATFISPAEAFFYNVQHLVNSDNQDDPIELKIRSIDKYDNFPFTPQAPNAHFKTVRVALPFVALLSESLKPHRKVFIDLLRYNDEHTRFDVIHHITDKSGQRLDICDMEKLQLSMEGTLAFLVGNVLHLHRPFVAPDRKEASVALPSSSDLIRYTPPRRCAFSQDGSQLSIWVVGEHQRSLKQSYYWRTYDISDPDTKHLHSDFKHATLSPPAAGPSSSRASDAALDVTMTTSYLYEPFSQKSVYLACDENGRLWLPSNRGPSLLKTCDNHPIVEGAYMATTHLRRVMLVLARPAATTADANPEIHLVQGELPPPDAAPAQNLPKLKVIRGWCPLLNKDHSARCGFASFATGANLNNIGFVASYLDGTLEIYAPTEKESRPVDRRQSAIRRSGDGKGRAPVREVPEVEPT